MAQILFSCNGSKFITSSKAIATFTVSDEGARAELGRVSLRQLTVLHAVDGEVPDPTWFTAKKSLMLS